MNSTTPRICLIGGTGRCGTSVLKRIFASHPAVGAITPELRILTDPDGVCSFHAAMERTWSPFVFDTGYRRLHRLLHAAGTVPVPWKMVQNLRDRLFTGQRGVLGRTGVPYYRHRLDRRIPGYAAAVDRLCGALESFAYDGTWVGAEPFSPASIRFGAAGGNDRLREHLGRFIRELARACCPDPRTHFVEDDPFNLLQFPVILELVPEARLVHVYRDPRDVIASYRTMAWAPAELGQAVQWYLGIMRRWQDLKRLLVPNTYLEVALETLVDDRERVTADLCRFWELDNDRSLYHLSLDRAHSGRWRNEFNSRERDYLNRELVDVLRILGYEA